MNKDDKENNLLNFLPYGRKLSWNILSLICFISLFLLNGCAKDIQEKNAAQDYPADQNRISEKSQSQPVKILFVGDMMFDRYIREAVGKYGKGDYSYVFEPVKEILSGYDLVIGNLEGPITGKESVSAGTAMDGKRNLVFTFDPGAAGALAANNIRLVNLGNNHTLNQGEEGLAETKKYLDEAGVEYFGDTGGDEQRFLIKEISGIKIGFVNYNYSIEDSFKKAVEDIENIKKQANVALVCPHWGTEYKTGDPGSQIKDLGHKFIDAGADAVIGTHPHVIETSEMYEGKKIYYSLGNFIFDQYFQKETTEGLGVEITINPDHSLQYNEVGFIMNKRGQTEVKP